jgi:hypothetical protein
MSDSDRIWANLVHLSYNMWCDWPMPEAEANHTAYKPFLRFDDCLWDDLVRRMAAEGLNMVVLDLGDGVRYESHPEIAVRHAWSPARLKRELARLRGLGLEPIPKLNFSTAHDAWLGPYSRCVSTDAYYAVCRDLIREVAQLFGKPRFFHLGMDEETAQHQARFEYAVLRQHDLWWRDLYFYFRHVEAAGCRPWVWSDYLWHHPELFWKKMPKHVLQSNWYYGFSFSRKLPHVQAYLDLDRHGYEQVPTGSNWNQERNFERTVSFCTRNLKPARLLGFMQSSWKPTLEVCRDRNVAAIEQVGRAIQWRARHTTTARG